MARPPTKICRRYRWTNGWADFARLLGSVRNCGMRFHVMTARRPNRNGVMNVLITLGRRMSGHILSLMAGPAAAEQAMIRTCTSCGQRNRVPSQRLTHVGRCGQCGNALPPLAEPIQVDAAQFREIVQSVDVPVLVDFWAGWCGPCRRAAPEVAKTAGDMAGRAVVLKVDVEAEPQLAQEYRVNGIPHFAVLRFGKAVFQQSGLVGHRDMTRWLVAAER